MNSEQNNPQLNSDLEEIESLSPSSRETSIDIASESQLIADSWLDEEPLTTKPSTQLNEEVNLLEEKKQTLIAEIKALEKQKAQIQENLVTMVQLSVQELEERKQGLQVSLEQLERRRDRIQEEMRRNFAGVSQDLAIRIQGFKEYLVGSLQDLVASAELIELPQFEPKPEPKVATTETKSETTKNSSPQFTEQAFQQQTREIRQLLEKYRTRPDYYGPPWQLRRTFEAIHAQKVSNWFFSQGGRGALKSMGSRLQNILIASAIISIVHHLYANRTRTLILADTPEKLGEWRRSLQDCLGISRSDFGPERGVVLFEDADALVQKAERLVEDKKMPLVIIDETEDNINLSLLQFPLWLAFAPDRQQTSNYNY